MKRLSLYWNTLRYLRPVQIFGRIGFRLARPRPDLSPHPELAPLVRQPVVFEWRKPSLVGPATLRFLGETFPVDAPGDWNEPSRTALWLYNAHYFDDLLASGASGRHSWQADLVKRWIAENPAPAGTGWAPYPTSLRIVNWIFWQLRQAGEPSEAVVQSLAVQARYLTRRMEHHILGNHLIANAKALAFAGLYFTGSDAQDWYRTGMALLRREFGEQIEADGGHFERSPMYHNIILTDLLDLLNIHAAFDVAPPDGWKRLAEKMLNWSRTMSHPDGEIALFNDAAFEIAPNLAQLTTYAAMLGLSRPDESAQSLTALPQSGYVRLDRDGAVALVDIAPIGPDYLPAHAHADTLSFELSLGGRRVIVNGGTSRYGVDAERARQRGTASHSTLVLDGEDSSEVWSGFRVARRARIVSSQWSASENGLQVSGTHDGYGRLRGKPLHRRDWTLGDGSLAVTDTVTGTGEHRAAIMFHLGPDIVAERIEDGSVVLSDRANGSVVARARSEMPDLLSIAPSSWHPRFGDVIQTRCLRVEIASRLPIRHTMTLTWDLA